MNNHKLHTELCQKCLTVKRTGMTIEQYQKWQKEIGQRSALERSLKTLNANFDIKLLTDKICFECSLDFYDNGEGIVVSE